METTFKVGDKVTLIDSNVGSRESSNWSKKAGLRKGSKYTVTEATDSGGVPWIRLAEKKYYHQASKFAKVMPKEVQPAFTYTPDAIIVVIRRKQDGKVIDRFLEDKGYDVALPGVSNIRVVHVKKRHDTTVIGTCGFKDGSGAFLTDAKHRGSREALEYALFFVEKTFGYKNLVVVKTKPSINNAIATIEKFI